MRRFVDIVETLREADRSADMCFKNKLIKLTVYENKEVYRTYEVSVGYSAPEEEKNKACKTLITTLFNDNQLTLIELYRMLKKIYGDEDS